MSKYLDNNGLSYFWQKLKDYFQPKLVSGTNIKTVNSNSLLGSGNVAIHEVPSGGTSGQVLAKNSNTDYDLKWVNQSGGGGGTLTAVELTQSDYNALSSAQKQLDVLYLVNDLASGGSND